MGRLLGVDLGSKRIGIAVSDPTGVVVTPLEVIARSGDLAADHEAILAIAREQQAERVVVGLPTALSGRKGIAARAALDEIAALQAAAGDALPIEPYDERLTTVIANRTLLEGNVKRAQRRKVVDKVAAAVLLQSYLEAHRG